MGLLKAGSVVLQLVVSCVLLAVVAVLLVAVFQSC
jgi:hypothetical protein